MARRNHNSQPMIPNNRTMPMIFPSIPIMKSISIIALLFGDGIS